MFRLASILRSYIRRPTVGKACMAAPIFRPNFFYCGKETIGKLSQVLNLSTTGSGVGEGVYADRNASVFIIKINKRWYISTEIT